MFGLTAASCVHRQMTAVYVFVEDIQSKCFIRTTHTHTHTNVALNRPLRSGQRGVKERSDYLVTVNAAEIILVYFLGLHDGVLVLPMYVWILLWLPPLPKKHACQVNW